MKIWGVICIYTTNFNNKKWIDKNLSIFYNYMGFPAINLSVVYPVGTV